MRLLKASRWHTRTRLRSSQLGPLYSQQLSRPRRLAGIFLTGTANDNGSENYLKKEKETDKDKGKRGQRRLVHLSANVGMSEQEILDHAFRSKYIKRRVTVENGKAKEVLLEYTTGRSD